MTIPALIPGINLLVPGRQVLYKLLCSFGYVPDLHYNGKKYAPDKSYEIHSPWPVAATEWHPVLSGSPAETLELKLTTLPPDENFMLMLSIGIAFGTIGAGNNIVQVEHAGAAKILMTM